VTETGQWHVQVMSILQFPLQCRLRHRLQLPQYALQPIDGKGFVQQQPRFLATTLQMTRLDCGIQF
jgi:hypothetical protein